MTSELSDSPQLIGAADGYIGKLQTSPATHHVVDHDDEDLQVQVPAVNGTVTPPDDAGGPSQSGAGVYNGIENGVGEDVLQPPPLPRETKVCIVSTRLPHC